MTSNQAVCNRIADLCKEQGITYYTLACRAAIPQSTLKIFFMELILHFLPLVKYAVALA